MKIIRSGIFETNSSSAHSIVFCKDKSDVDELDQYRVSSRIFGHTWDQITDDWSDWWDQDGKIHFDRKNKYEFNFCRGLPRVYDDFVHKAVFLIAYYNYKDNDKCLHIIDFVKDRAQKLMVKYDKFIYSIDRDRLHELVRFYFKTNKLKSEKSRSDILYYDMSNTSHVVSRICNDDNLLEKFLFDSRSYVVASGDEYQDSYLKLVGTEVEYIRHYGEDIGSMKFEERANEIYDSKHYDFDYGI